MNFWLRTLYVTALFTGVVLYWLFFCLVLEYAG
jgi:hypothetical protein